MSGVGYKGQPDLAATIRQMRSEIQALQRGTQQTAAPLAGVRLTTPQTVPNVTDTLVTFDTVDFDNVGMWNAAQPTQLTVPYAGVFMATVVVEFSVTPPSIPQGIRSVTVTAGGQDRAKMAVDTSQDGDTTVAVPAFASLTFGDEIAVRVRQSNGSVTVAVTSASLAVVHLGLA